MNNVSLFRKFQLFDNLQEGENNSLIVQSYPTNVFYKLNNVSLTQMKAITIQERKQIDTFIIGNGTVTSLPSTCENNKSLNKNLLFKIYNGEILDEYEIYKSKLFKFDYAEYKDRRYVICFGIETVNMSINRREEKSMPVSSIKVCDVTKCLVKENNESLPLVIRDIKIMKKSEDEPVVIGGNMDVGCSPLGEITSFAISDNLFHAAIGGNNGRVLICSATKNNFIDTKEKDYSQIKCHFLKNITDSKITNLYFTRDRNNKLILYFSSEKGLFYANIEDKNYEPQSLKIDGGIIENCLNINQNDHNRLCYFSENTGTVNEYIDYKKGKTYLFEGKIESLCYLNNYMVYKLDNGGKKYLGVIDSVNKIFLYFEELINDIKLITTEKDCIYYLNEDNLSKTNQIICLKERDNKAKFDSFYERNFFDTAYEFARNLNYSNVKLAEILQNHAEYLYSKGEYEKSISQYIKTINYLDPSYVIQKFLDGSKLDYLIAYLEELRTNKEFRSNSTRDVIKDYTALLLNCYIKQKYFNKLKKFVDNANKSEKEMILRTAVEVCIDQQETELALQIAEKNKTSELTIQILIELKNNYHDAVESLKNENSRKVKFDILLKYGKKLLQKEPELTITILLGITNDIILAKSNNDYASSSENQDIYGLNYEDLFIIFEDNVKEVVEHKQFLELIAQKDPKCSKTVLHRILELDLDEYTILTEKKEKKEIELNKSKNNNEKLQLEYNNLIKQISDCSDNILRYIRAEEYSNKIDKEFVLLIFKMHNFREGIIELSEMMKKYSELLQLYMQDTAIDYDDCYLIFDKIIVIMQKYEAEDPKFWVQTLNFFINHSNNIDVNKYLSIILDRIISLNLLTFGDIMQKISKANKIDLEVIKPFLLDFVKAKKESFIQERDKYKKSKEKFVNLCTDLYNSQTRAKTYVGGTKCNFCKQSLTVPPFTFFLCGHAYHNYCMSGEISTGNKYCIECMKKNKELTKKIEKAKETAEDQTSFIEDLKKANEKIDVIADYLGKGDINTVIFKTQKKKRFPNLDLYQ